MARNRNKVYQQGDRINIYLSRDLTPEFVDWINKQSDLSNFFLYAVQQLYQQTGFVDVAEVMPRKINYDLSSMEVNNTSKIEMFGESEETAGLEKEKSTEDTGWGNLEEIEDPYA